MSEQTTEESRQDSAPNLEDQPKQSSFIEQTKVSVIFFFVFLPVTKKYSNQHSVISLSARNVTGRQSLGDASVRVEFLLP